MLTFSSIWQVLYSFIFVQKKHKTSNTHNKHLLRKIDEVKKPKQYLNYRKCPQMKPRARSLKPRGKYNCDDASLPLRQVKVFSSLFATPFQSQRLRSIPSAQLTHFNFLRMASKFGLAGGIPERRVRPIWDAVDSRQFKNALKLCTALLSKYPNSPYALVSLLARFHAFFVDLIVMDQISLCCYSNWCC